MNTLKNHKEGIRLNLKLNINEKKEKLIFI